MALSWVELGMLTATGCVAGWMNVMAGGGSLLTVPVMLFMGVPAPVANGTNRIAILAETATAVTVFFRRGYSDIRLSAGLALMACVGAVGGASLGVRLDGVWFDWLLGAVLIVVLYLMASGGKRAEIAEARPKRLAAGHALMIVAGFWGGMVQVGVGILFLLPILHRVMGMDLVRCNAHKTFIVLSYTVISLLIFSSQVELLWLAGLALALGNAFGGWLGAHTTITKGDKWIRRVIYIVLAAFAVKLLVF